MANVSFYLGSSFAATGKTAGAIYFDKANHCIWVGDNLIIPEVSSATAVAQAIATAKQEAINAAASAADSKDAALVAGLSSSVSAGELGQAGSTIAGVQVLTGITQTGGTLASATSAAADAYGSAAKALADAEAYADGLIAGLSASDAAVANQFVTSVSEANGVITVTRAQPSAGDISVQNLSTEGISGGDLQTVLGRLEQAIDAGGAGSVVTVEKLATAETGYAASYIVKQGATQVGATINIPKDFLVKSATLATSTGAGDPSSLPEGAKYIDFTVNAKDSSETAEHIYLPVNDLVDVYTAGNGLTLSAGNEFAGVVDANNANGLSVGASGFAMALASTAAAGAMSAADKAKLDGIETGGQVNVIETVKVDGVALTPDANKAVDIDLSGKVDVEAGKGLSTEDYTTAEKTKLSGVEAGAQENVIEEIQVNGATVAPSNKVVNISVPSAADLLPGLTALNVVVDDSYVHTDNNYTTAEKEKLAGIDAGAEVNVLETITVNGATTAVTVSGKNADLAVVESVSGTGAINVTTGPNPVVSIVWEEYN